jgi:hypothetical protein
MEQAHAVTAPIRHPIPPKGLHPAVARLIEALARAQVNREDREKRGMEAQESESGDR